MQSTKYIFFYKIFRKFPDSLNITLIAVLSQNDVQSIKKETFKFDHIQVFETILEFGKLIHAIKR